MREIQVNRHLKLREDGTLLKVKTGKVYIPAKSDRRGYFIYTPENPRCSVHGLVMKYFGIPKPSDKHVLRHINKDNYDNRLENLEWVSKHEIQRYNISALPVGERKCDYDDPIEYNRAKGKRHYAKCGKDDYMKNHVKRLGSAKKQRVNKRGEVIARTVIWRKNNPDYVRQKNKERYDALTPEDIEKLYANRREKYKESKDIRFIKALMNTLCENKKLK